MDEEEIADNLKLRISEMKQSFQQSYDVFIKAHEELSNISFDPATSTSGTSLSPLAKLHLETKDVNEIVHAGSIDDCISKLRSKISSDDVEHENTFLDVGPVTKLLKIMAGLQTDIESLTENQKQFSKLTDSINTEMSLIEKRMQNSISQLADTVVESLDDSEASEDDFGEEEEETFGSEPFSD